jgi:hypothetical protein
MRQVLLAGVILGIVIAVPCNTHVIDFPAVGLSMS